jgi:hypothetical protein
MGKIRYNRRFPAMSSIDAFKNLRRARKSNAPVNIATAYTSSTFLLTSLGSLLIMGRERTIEKKVKKLERAVRIL